MGRGEVYTGFRWENLRVRDHFEDPGVDGMIIFRLIFRKEGNEWIDLAQDRDRCWAHVNAAMNHRVP
jgi:hypothetical protein